MKVSLDVEVTISLPSLAIRMTKCGDNDVQAAWARARLSASLSI